MDVKFYINMSNKPPMIEGKVNYYDLNFIKNVKSDQKLFSFYNISSEDLKKIPKIVGPGLRLVRDKKEVSVFAISAGALTCEKGIYQINDEIVVSGNVDFTTGNLLGDIVNIKIEGDCKDKFILKTKGDIKINGSLGDSIVKCKNLNVGNIAKGSQNIRILNLLIAKNIYFRENIYSKSLKIKNTIKNSIIGCQEGIIENSFMSTIFVENNIKFKNLGSETLSKNVIVLGINKNIYDKIKNLQENIKKNKIKLNVFIKEEVKLKNDIFDISRKPKKTDKELFLLEKYNLELTYFEEDIKKLKNILHKLSVDYNKYSSVQVNLSSSIRILGKLYPGNVIKIGDLNNIRIYKVHSNVLISYSKSEGLIIKNCS